jgi:thiol-disulfide isomerase/thioredoxin
MSGFKVDDFVLEFNDVPIKSVSDLVGKVGAIEPGAQAKIICHSGTKTVHRNVVLDLRPDMRELFVSEWRGRPMPNVDVLRARDQKRVELSGAQRKGTILVIDYFATWCGPCKRIMPDLSELQKSYEGQGVQVIGVSGEDRETVEQYRLKYTPDYQLAVDDTGVFRRELNVSVLPTIWIVDRRGIIQDIWFGAGHMPKVRDSLKKLLEAPVKE